MTPRSSDAFKSWATTHADVVERQPHRLADARSKLELARLNVARARNDLDRDDPDRAVIAAETAIVNAADAVLANAGYRIRGKTGSHEARFDFPGLPVEFSALADRVGAARRSRNRAMYDYAGGVPDRLARELVDVAMTLVGAAAAVVG
jgi:hypothetical protein